MATRERVTQLLKAWPKIYPTAHCELDFRSPLQRYCSKALAPDNTAVGTDALVFNTVDNKTAMGAFARPTNSTGLSYRRPQ
jgi:hypothetical protein